MSDECDQVSSVAIPVEEGEIIKPLETFWKWSVPWPIVCLWFASGFCMGIFVSALLVVSKSNPAMIPSQPTIVPTNATAQQTIVPTTAPTQNLGASLTTYLEMIPTPSPVFFPMMHQNICSLEVSKESILAASRGEYPSLGCKIYQTTLAAALLEIPCSSLQQFSLENATQNSAEKVTPAPCSFDSVVNSINSAQAGQQQDLGECKLYETTLFAALIVLRCGKTPVPNAFL